MDEPRTYTGWKAALAAVAACAVVFVTLNLIGRAYRSEPKPTPKPTVVTVTPTR